VVSERKHKNVSKRFFSETTWTIETKLPRNDHWKVLYKIQVFYADRKSKMVATAGNRLTSGYFSQAETRTVKKKWTKAP
jgi:hypothetical protein